MSIRLKLYELFKVYPVGDANERFASYEAELADLKRELSISQMEVAGKEVAAHKARRIVNLTVNDPSPSDVKKRKDYVARVSNFAPTIRPKIMQIIANLREELDWNGFTDFSHKDGLPQGMTRNEWDWLMRGGSNFGKLLLDWFDEMEGEHVQNSDQGVTKTNN